MNYNIALLIWFQNNDMKDVTDENILSEIHHLTMAVKAAQLEEFPDSYTDRIDVEAVSFGFFMHESGCSLNKSEIILVLSKIS